MDDANFERAKKKVIGIDRLRPGIGTLGEKTVHAVLKHYYAPDEAAHEIPLCGYVADVFDGKRILEIQTAGFHRMRDKLNAFLPLYPVTIVYPIPNRKWLIWVDPETGECSGRRKSPVSGSVYRAFTELYKIKAWLKQPGLTLCFPLIDMEEYRLLDGWSRDRKKGSHRYDRIPISLEGETVFTCPRDYLQLIPYDLEEPFTVRDFAAEVHISADLARTVLAILYDLGLVDRPGKKGRAYLYTVRE